MTETQSPQTDVENKMNDKFSNPDRILTLTAWAKIISWVLFGIGGILIALALIQAADNFGRGYNALESLLLIVLSLLPVFLGLVLQFLIEGIFLAADIERNTGANSKPQQNAR